MKLPRVSWLVVVGAGAVAIEAAAGVAAVPPAARLVPKLSVGAAEGATAVGAAVVVGAEAAGARPAALVPKGDAPKLNPVLAAVVVAGAAAPKEGVDPVAPGVPNVKFIAGDDSAEARV